MSEAIYRFGRFRFDSGSRRLLKDGEPVPLGARAFDILHLLLKHHDRFVPKEEIIRTVWARLIVEDNNLTVHISSLRRHLDEGMIQTVHGRGYRFIAPVDIEAEVRTPAGNISASKRRSAEVASVATSARKSLWIGAGLLTTLIAGAVLLGSINQPEPWSSTDRRASNVILSTENLSGDPALDQIARQFTDAARWNLSDNYMLSVATYAVEHATQLSDAELREIGRKFDSHFIIVYGLRKDGDGIAINASLVDARTGVRVMTDSVVTTAYRTLAEQRILSAALGHRLSFTELEIEAAHAAHVRPNALDARDLTTRALMSDPSSQALEDINRAREMAPDALAPLWVAAQVRSEAVAAGVSADPAADTTRALAEIDRAFEYQPSNAVIAGARAYVLNNLGLLDEAWNAYDRVHDIAPGEPFAHLGKARIALHRGQLDLAQTELEGMKNWRQQEKRYLGAKIAFARGDYEATIKGEERTIAMYGESVPFVKYSKLAQASAVAPKSTPGWWHGTNLSELRAKREQFGLPDEAWDRLVLGLQGAGMAE